VHIFLCLKGTDNDLAVKFSAEPNERKYATCKSKQWSASDLPFCISKHAHSEWRLTEMNAFKLFDVLLKPGQC
jgi:hypothetical protein